MEKPIKSVIRTLDLDVRKLLFLHLLVVYRENDNAAMLKYIRDDIPMRLFVMAKVDRHFWDINHLQYTINYHEHGRLEVFEGVYAILDSMHIKSFEEILNLMKQKGLTFVCFFFTPSGLALSSGDDIKGDGIAISADKFITFRAPKKIFTIKVNIDNTINKLSSIKANMLFRVKRNRVQISSHTSD